MQDQNNSPFRALAFKEDELAIIKKLFADNDAGILAVRNFLLQFELSAQDKSFLALLTDEDIAFLRRAFIPKAGKDTKMGSLTTDPLASIDVSSILTENAKNVLAARRLSVKYFDQQLSLLRADGSVPEFVLADFDFGENADLVTHEARRVILSQVDFTLMQLRTTAGKNAPETPEQVQKRMQADSAE